MNTFEYDAKKRYCTDIVSQALIVNPHFATLYTNPGLRSVQTHMVLIEALMWLKDELKHLIRHHKDHIANCKMVGYMSALSIHNQQLLKCEKRMREYNKLICQARHSKQILVKIGG